MSEFLKNTDLSLNKAEKIVSDTLNNCDDGELYLEESNNESIILDDNKMKHHLCTPGTNIPVKPNGFLKQYKETDKILFIPLAWNFYDEIRSRILKTRDNKNDYFLSYFPTVRVTR